MLLRGASYIGVVWLAQIIPLAFVLSGPTWDQYWQLRRIYRPGLIVHRWLFDDLLPARFFSPFDRAGVMIGFGVASLLYALVSIGMWMLLKRLMKKQYFQSRQGA